MSARERAREAAHKAMRPHENTSKFYSWEQSAIIAAIDAYFEEWLASPVVSTAATTPEVVMNSADAYAGIGRAASSELASIISRHGVSASAWRIARDAYRLGVVQGMQDSAEICRRHAQERLDSVADWSGQSACVEAAEKIMVAAGGVKRT